MSQTALGWKADVPTEQPGRYGSETAANRWLLRLATVVLVLFAALGFWYGMVIPPFETPDEVYHYAFARHLAQGNSLPVQDDEATGPWQQEGSQAPLYYWLVGRLTSGVDQDDFDALAVFNPRSNMGNPLYAGNKNRMLYSAASRPLHGTNLALHIGRVVSTLLGLITLASLFATARLAFPDRAYLPLFAVGLAAAIPQFVFISASFTNDNMIIATAAATLYWLARLFTVEDDTEIPNLAWLVLGGLLGLAALSKLQGLGLWLLAAGAGCWLAWRRRELHLLPKIALLVAAPAVAIAGWWYWRNFRLYGDWTGMAHLVSINGMRGERLEWGDFWHEFRGLRYSFWGLFGWFNILLPAWFYRIMDWVAILAGVGFVLHLLGAYFPLLRRSGLRERFAVGVSSPPWSLRPLRKGRVARKAAPSGSRQSEAEPSMLSVGGLDVQLLAVAWVVISVGLLLYWMNRAEGSQGRLLFPALTAALIVLVAGLDFWLRSVPRWPAVAAWCGLFLLLLGNTVYAGAILLPNSYGTPSVVAELPAAAHEVGLAYGEQGQVELVGITTPNPRDGPRFYPGDDVPVTLYMRASEPIVHDHELFIQLLDEQGEVLGNVTSHPGWGRHPTSLWQPGVLYEDVYQVRVDRMIGSDSPLLARVYVGFVDAEDDDGAMTPMVTRSTDGEEVTPFVAQVALVPREPAQLKREEEVTTTRVETREVGAVFGASIRLAASQADVTVQAGGVVTPTLLWIATAQPATEYVGFVHVLDAQGVWIGGFDRAPAAGRYPTSFWRAGDRIVSQFPVHFPPDVAPGPYEIWAGLYEQASQGATRLPVSDANGQSVANDMVKVAEMTVLE